MVFEPSGLLWAKEDLNLHDRLGSLAPEASASASSAIRPCKCALNRNSLVGERGLEPPRPCDHSLLKAACIPVSPLARGTYGVFYQIFNAKIHVLPRWRKQKLKLGYEELWLMERKLFVRRWSCASPIWIIRIRRNPFHIIVHCQITT